MQPGIYRRMILHIREYGSNIFNHQMVFPILQERPHLKSIGGTDADKGFLSVYAEGNHFIGPIKEDGFFSGTLCIRMEGKSISYRSIPWKSRNSSLMDKSVRLSRLPMGLKLLFVSFSCTKAAESWISP